ncbi:zinc finger protein hangover [Lutzomyia longipalpis]|nr:zinc finger protein hangover [Lutzomyia longipalpis]XP_055681185.1 zinc finger protein hangover [Lutzomyia longipalpis]XP_055681186.1 zinc finger protein hangover [Lutzomyia longipalpis]XP_055681187.1 zinc finger protein hangover [Lutzomyia longipalpis]
MESAKTMMGIKRDCRLCLAPDNECVSIFTTAAADRESLSMKIQACVNIKVHQTDSLSPRICHACISYLNSWQSFKNRCYAAQRKQKAWLANQLQQQLREVQESKKRRLGAEGDDQQVVGKRTRETSPDEDFYPDKHSKATSATTSQRPSVAESESFIKQEPRDEEEQEGPVTVNMELDPREFLAHNDSEDEYQDDEGGHNDEGPPILTSLGLTHINHVNPFNYLATDLEEFDQDGEDGESSLPFGGIPGQLKRRSQPSIPAHCQICRMKFSNRANARRHERNIHGIKISAENGDITVVQKPPNVQPKRPGGEQGGNSGHVGGAAGGGGGGDDGKPPMATLKKPTKPVVEEFDYSKPEKYRHLLTENKLSFIRRNLKFLGQYQDMKCKCCDRVYSTYKTFMSHMRKRFLSLPRNMCFKCLRQFETKGQFIAHLKKKNCLNLYTLYMADTTISKVFHTSSASGKIGPKEILANKAYGCQLCTEHFRLKSDFRTHVLESHPDVQNFRDPITGNCTYCKATFEEASQRKRHFGNLECLVFLICGNCEERFDSNPQFLDHVYATHLTKQGRESIQKQASSQMLLMQNGDEESNREMDESGVPNSRSAQNCPVCGKQYNNYYNVLRHMESKHPDKMPKTYHCEICQTGFARQTELREHVKSAHGELSLTKVKPISFICKECKSQFDKKEAWIEHQVSHGKFMCQQCDYTVTARDEFETHLATHIKLKVYSCGVCKASFNTEEGLQYHTMTTHLVLDSDEALFREITKAESSDAAAKSEAKDPQSVVDALNLHLDGVEIIAKPRESIPKPPSQQTTPSKLDVSMDVSIEPGTSQKPLQYNSRMRCRVCQKRISSKVGYRNHLLIEHQINDCHFVSCDLCPAEFSNEKGLRVHMFRSHNVSVKEDEAIPMDQQHFECNICHTVYRSVDQLRDHVNTVHAGTSLSEFEESTEHSIVIPKEEKQPVVTEELPDYTPIEVWFQCRYCDENFNSNKKLTIHMNTHEEHDKTDYTCRDCGNVYGTRKSLWVHRHKKHPRPQMPSPCEVCSKVFFDKTELGYHLKTHGAIKKSLLDGISGDAEEAGSDTGKYSCHVCGRKFQDKSPLSKHLRIHEMENSMFSSSLLVTALSDSVEAPEQPSNWGNSLLNNDGEFSCDICPKTFSLLSALKVHRGWHFRSPDGRQVTDPGNLWQPGTLPPSRAKRFRPLPSKQPVCPYCSSKFASANNLRRHIVEVHKRNESRMNREAVNPGGVQVEKERECSACNKAFETHIEWIEHKMGHAKNQKPSTTFEWNCEICGKMFTRKERLLQHMITHLNSTTDGQENDGDDMEDEMEEEEQENSSEPKEEVMAEEVAEQEVVAEEVVAEEESDEKDEEVEGDQHSCDLCQVFFKTSAELRRHVTSHFINGAATIGNEEIKGDSPSPISMKIEVEEEVIVKRDPSESKLIEQVIGSDDEDDDEIEEDEDVEELDEEDESIVEDDDGHYEEEDEEFMEEYIDADEIEPKQDEVSSDNADKSEAIVYKCRICATPHRSHFASIKCMEAHRMPTEWKCTKCQVFFGDAQQMREHLKLMHE